MTYLPYAQPDDPGRRPAGAGARLVLLAALAAAPALAACAQSPTEVITMINVDTSAPPILLLRATLFRTSDPTDSLSQSQWSPNEVSDADRPGPYNFPFDLPVSASPSLAGPATVTVEGLDWDTNAVIASGSAPAVVVAGQKTNAALIMSAGPLTCGNGVVDPGETCDDGNHTAGDGCSPGCMLEGGAADAGAD